MANLSITCPSCGQEARAELFPHHSGAGALDFECDHCHAMGWTPMSAQEIAGLRAMGQDIVIPEPPITDAEVKAVTRVLDDTDAAWFDFWKADHGIR